MIVAGVAALALRLAGLAVKAAMASSPGIWSLMYLPPLAGLIAAWWLTRTGSRAVPGVRERQKWA